MTWLIARICYQTMITVSVNWMDVEESGFDPVLPFGLYFHPYFHVQGRLLTHGAFF